MRFIWGFIAVLIGFTLSVLLWLITLATDKVKVAGSEIPVTTEAEDRVIDNPEISAQDDIKPNVMLTSETEWRVSLPDIAVEVIEVTTPQLSETLLALPLNGMLRQLVELANQGDIDARYLLAQQIHYCWAYHDEKRLAEQSGNLVEQGEHVILNDMLYSKAWGHFCDQVNNQMAQELLSANIQQGHLPSAISYYHVAQPNAENFHSADELLRYEQIQQYRQELLVWAFEEGSSEAAHLLAELHLYPTEGQADIPQALAYYWLVAQHCPSLQSNIDTLEQQLTIEQKLYAERQAIELQQVFTSSGQVEVGCRE